MTMQRYILRQQSSTAPTPEEVGAELAATGKVRILDRGAKYLYVTGDDIDRILEKAKFDGWALIREQRYELPEQPVLPIRKPKSAA
jgi:hypothetical protein